ncbi:MAG: HTTM domain-containing protein [Bacteroidetes bacterium]|nr:MAG: HTTM domain-containing protein [Bacteroidota bacterium]
METKEANTSKYLREPVSIYSLAGFRVLFGLCMVLSTLRFIGLDWVEDHYLNSDFHFHYYGFAWVKALAPSIMTLLHYVLILSSLGVMLGFYYRISAIVQFVLFTYFELIDLTYYLNHYYYVSLVCFLLIFVPANRAFSLDTAWRKLKPYSHVPRYIPGMFMLLMGIVYTYAGIAKINPEWLFNAQPLRIWLPASYDVPVLGNFFAWKYSPWLFAWAGMLYDCSIFFLLLNKKTRPWAYASVILFHSLTGILFQIGVFPVVMMAGTLIFFSAEWHLRWMRWVKPNYHVEYAAWQPKVWIKKPLEWGLAAFFAIQLLFPWRFILYPGNFHWTENAYRFGWRVMLVEKAGTATFYIKDDQGREGMVDNRDYLNKHQEKQMSYQPDMLLQFAHFLGEQAKAKGIENPEVRAEVYVTYNGRPSALFIDSTVNLLALSDSWKAKDWIKPYPF